MAGIPKDINTTYDVVSAFRAIEDELTASMIRNLDHHRAEELEAGFNWSQWQVEQLAALDAYKKRNLKKYQGIFKNINLKIDTIISMQRAAGNADQEVSILKAIKEGAKLYKAKKQVSADGRFFKENDKKINALIKATRSDFKKAEVAILRRANDQYRQVIFNAQMYAATGATYEKAVDMATKDFLRAGINCIEYKNGARHTMSEYADMALRTAQKRAYLTGEGEKRQEWGISTVIMNKRGNPCPKCLPFVGKVLIDDVWSGGKPEDGPYPLMSTAISKDLYHPRCKDSHTTYFKGISTADDTWTEEELQAVNQGNKQEAREQYARLQAEKYGRMSKYSLDGENKRKYGARAEEWERICKKEDAIDKEIFNGIMESDLGAFKNKLRSNSEISKEYYTELKNKFSHGSKSAKHLFIKYASEKTIEVSRYEGIAYFSPKIRKIYMNYGTDLVNERGIGATWFHEHGHLIDMAAGNISDNQEFKKLINADVNNYRIMYGKKSNLKTYEEIDKAIGMEIQDMRKHSAVSDLLDGATKGSINGCAGHSIDYWKYEKSITLEAFAHMYEAQFDKIRYEEMRKYFPRSLEYFEKMIKEASK